MVHLVNTAPGLVSRLIRGKMPGGFNSLAIKSYLSKNLGLGSSRSDSVPLLGTTLEPPKRLTSEAEGKSWLDGIVPVYAQRSGISLVAPGAGGTAGGGRGSATINGKEFLKFQADQQKFAAQPVELYMRYLGCDHDLRAGEAAFDHEKATNLALQATSMVILILKEYNRFDILRARHFDLSWNWVRQLCTMTSFLVGLHGKGRYRQFGRIYREGLEVSCSKGPGKTNRRRGALGSLTTCKLPLT